jgi:hypothetical protein
MKATKRNLKNQERKAQKAERGKPGKGKSRYALKQKIDNRPGSPFRTKITFVEEPENTIV